MTGARTVATSIGEFSGHVEIASRLVDHGPPGPCRGAMNHATVAAYWLAATAAESESTYSDKVTALRNFVATVEPEDRPFRATLIDAALVAEADFRIATGGRILGRRLCGWMDAAASGLPPTPSSSSSAVLATGASRPLG